MASVNRVVVAPEAYVGVSPSWRVLARRADVPPPLLELFFDTLGAEPSETPRDLRLVKNAGLQFMLQSLREGTYLGTDPLDDVDWARILALVELVCDTSRARPSAAPASTSSAPPSSPSPPQPASSSSSAPPGPPPLRQKTKSAANLAHGRARAAARKKTPHGKSRR